MHLLVVTTSSNSLAPGHPTGPWPEDFAIPDQAATEAGIPVTAASPRDGAVPLDPKTEPNATQRADWAPALQALSSSVTLESVKGLSFDGIFIPGGHGPMVDLANDAVCHGPAALVRAKRSNGEPFFQSRRATGFTNTEAQLAGLNDTVPFLLEDALKESGAGFHSALLPMLSHAELDGNLLTGRHPQSSAALAAKLVGALVRR